jgi:hypothetical protein
MGPDMAQMFALFRRSCKNLAKESCRTPEPVYKRGRDSSANLAFRDKGADMRLLLAVCATAAMLAVPTQASAWVCRAEGISSTGTGSGRTVERAKASALSRCEASTKLLFPLCTIKSCGR